MQKQQMCSQHEHHKTWFKTEMILKSSVNISYEE